MARRRALRCELTRAARRRAVHGTRSGAQATGAVGEGVVRKSALANGIRVLSEDMPGAASVALGLWVENGSRYEPPARNGLSHFIEHLLFKGTDRRSAAAIAEEIDAVGGALNADTDREFTCYHARVTGDHAGLAVDLLSDVFLASRFDSEDVEREKEVVYEEIAQIEDTPDDHVHDLFHRAFWQPHPLAMPVCGTRATVARFDREACLAWFAERYRPNRLVVAAAGRVDHAALCDDIARRFEAMAGAAALDDGPPPRPRAVVAVHERRLEQVQVCLGTLGVAAGDPQRDAAAVLNAVLGDSPSSRLFQEVRERRGRAYSIDSFLCAYRDAGYIGITAGTRARWVAEVVEVALATLGQIRREGLTRSELTRAKAKLKGALVLGLETAEQRMERLALQEIYLGRDVSVGEIAARIDAVGNDDVLALAERCFVPEGCALVLLGEPRGAVPDASVFDVLG